MDIHLPDETQTESLRMLFEAVFRHATMGILITGQKGNIILANQFALKEFGYDEPELIGKSVEQLIPQRFHQHHVGYRKSYHHHAETRAMGAGRDLYGLRKDGSEFPVEVSLSPFKTGSEQLVIAFIIDITIRKEKEKTEKEYEHVLISLAKEKELNDMKSRFVTMASHEFKTPLSTILSSASLLSKYTLTEDQSKREKHIERIKSAVLNLNGILNEFLSFGKIEHGNIEANYINFKLEDLIREACSELENIKKNKQEINYYHQGDSLVHLDKELLKNILFNLLTNAFKFSPEDGLIEINTSHIEGEVVLKIKDHGAGIPLDDQQHLFELFFRGNNVSHIQGTGLGLT
ncbi:MAG: PAS domain-containing sensor histidine kinase, partial [Chitinophagaceae bacterium]